jgi:hypothetical protein
MDEVFSSWPDITNQPIGHPNIEYFTDGSSFIQGGTPYAGYATVTLDSIIEALMLLIGTSHRLHLGTPAHCKIVGKHLY